MDYEGLETERKEFMDIVVGAMRAVLMDNKADFAEKIEAAKILDGYSDTIIKSRIVSNAGETTDKVVNRLNKQIDKLNEEN